MPAEGWTTEFPKTIQIQTRAQPDTGEWEAVGKCATQLPSPANNYTHTCTLATPATSRYIRTYFVDNHGNP